MLKECVSLAPCASPFLFAYDNGADFLFNYDDDEESVLNVIVD